MHKVRRLRYETGKAVIGQVKRTVPGTFFPPLILVVYRTIRLHILLLPVCVTCVFLACYGPVGFSFLFFFLLSENGVGRSSLSLPLRTIAVANFQLVISLLLCLMSSVDIYKKRAIKSHSLM